MLYSQAQISVFLLSRQRKSRNQELELLSMVTRSPTIHLHGRRAHGLPHSLLTQLFSNHTWVPNLIPPLL